MKKLKLSDSPKNAKRRFDELMADEEFARWVRVNGEKHALLHMMTPTEGGLADLVGSLGSSLAFGFLIGQENPLPKKKKVPTES